MTRLSLVLILCLMAGCAHVATKAPTSLPKAALAIILPLPPSFVVTWTNLPPPENPTNYFIAIETSGDLRNWRELARVPWQSDGSVTFSNLTAQAFYRACRGKKP